MCVCIVEHSVLALGGIYIPWTWDFGALGKDRFRVGVGGCEYVLVWRSVDDII
jgi:hypothetical protein